VVEEVDGSYPKLCDCVENNIEETLTLCRRPRQHHKNLNSTNLLVRVRFRQLSACNFCSSSSNCWFHSADGRGRKLMPVPNVAMK
jgi:hypothetical protein